MNQPDFDPDRQRIDPADVASWCAAARCRRGPPAPLRPGNFIRGPLPLTWLRRAAGLPGKALAVGLALWYLRGVKNHRTVRLTRETLHHLGVERKAGYRALEKLEEAGLVAVSRKRGRGPGVTILDTEENDAAPSADI